jgi:hypothetical protein
MLPVLVPVNRLVRNKAARWVFEALEHVVACFPFPILGIDSDNGSEFINEIWALDAAFTNYFLPQQKLVFKARNGAKVTKRHDQAKTPHQRAVAHKDVGKRPVIAMNAARVSSPNTSA